MNSQNRSSRRRWLLMIWLGLGWVVAAVLAVKNGFVLDAARGAELQTKRPNCVASPSHLESGYSAIGLKFERVPQTGFANTAKARVFPGVPVAGIKIITTGGEVPQENGYVPFFTMSDTCMSGEDEQGHHHDQNGVREDLAPSNVLYVLVKFH